jgi:hypothetical protein
MEKDITGLNKYKKAIKVIWYVILIVGGLAIALVTVFNILHITGAYASGSMGIDFTAPGLIMRIDGSALEGFMTPALISLEINMLAAWALLLYSIRQISGIFDTFADTKTPFIKGNIRRMKNISFAFFIYSAVIFIAGIIIKLAAVIPDSKEIGIDASIPLWPILCGFFILAVSEIFNYGFKLQQDNDSIV